MNAMLYIHGNGGNASESQHYEELFPSCDVIGLDYKTFTPWETGQEIRWAAEKLAEKYNDVTLVANSIGAFFSMSGNIDCFIKKAYFISPIVDMEKLIEDMMVWANVTEQELECQKVVFTDFGEKLSWEYLTYVRAHPISWNVPTQILYGSGDKLTSFATIDAFAEKHQAELTVMKNGEHWFHTDEQMRFLDNWIKSH